MKILYINEENIHIFRTTGRISMKFSGKMWLITILEVTKKQEFILSLENKFLEKPQEVQIDPKSFFRVKRN